MEYIFLIILPLIGGIITGTQVLLWVQAIIAAVIILYLNSSSVNKLELVGFLIIIPGAIFIVGMIIGDISWLIQTGAISGWHVSNPFVVSK